MFHLFQYLKNIYVEEYLLSNKTNRQKFSLKKCSETVGYGSTLADDFVTTRIPLNSGLFFFIGSDNDETGEEFLIDQP